MTGLRVTSERCERLLRQIRGVLAGRVIVNEEGQIERIHILARAGRPPGLVHKDVRAAFSAQFGIDLSGEHFRIAEIWPELDPVLAPSRPALHGVVVRYSGTEAEAEVTLGYLDEVSVGQARGPAAAPNTRRLIAEATLRAVQGLLGEDARMSLQDLAEVPLSEGSAVLAAVRCTNRRTPGVYTGSAILAGDTSDSIARCVLDATNRIFAYFRGIGLISRPGELEPTAETDTSRDENELLEQLRPRIRDWDYWGIYRRGED